MRAREGLLEVDGCGSNPTPTGPAPQLWGHYTQVVWAKSRNPGEPVASSGTTRTWVCNYDPPGNFVGQKPF